MVALDRVRPAYRRHLVADPLFDRRDPKPEPLWPGPERPRGGDRLISGGRESLGIATHSNPMLSDRGG